MGPKLTKVVTVKLTDKQAEVYRLLLNTCAEHNREEVTLAEVADQSKAMYISGGTFRKYSPTKLYPVVCALERHRVAYITWCSHKLAYVRVRIDPDYLLTEE